MHSQKRRVVRGPRQSDVYRRKYQPGKCESIARAAGTFRRYGHAARPDRESNRFVGDGKAAYLNGQADTAAGIALRKRVRAAARTRFRPTSRAFRSSQVLNVRPQ